jgi:hypothetical protein
VRKFVKECRREWRRLGVPDPVANEMAADLTADLEEAEAEGGSPEDVLGSAAFDPRSFAASWASERGVTEPPPPSRTPSRRSLVLAAGAALLIAVSVGGLAMLASSSGVAIFASRAGGRLAIPAPSLPRPPAVAVMPFGLRQSTSRVDVHAVGWLLVIGGIVGIVFLLVLWSWAGPGRWPHQRISIHELPGRRGY